ncbi:MAG: hypothetical protein M1816_003070 [Peltula sp. TS41687]|nr:MAG: hypothetical protein M1816_003070 [Peltula sp. TS41687]
MDEAVAQFVSITNSSPQVAEQYLRLSDGHLEQAMQLFFESGGIDLVEQDTAAAEYHTQPSAARSSPPRQRSSGHAGPAPIVRIDSDEELSDDDGPQVTGWRQRDQPRLGNDIPSRNFGHATPPTRHLDTEDDEAIARRMQEELYAGQDNSGGVRAPLARTTETLVGPGADWGNDGEDAMAAAIQAQMAAQRTRIPARAGIFNQHATNVSVWGGDSGSDPNSRRRVLSQATGGASETSSKASMLAEMYRPPVELMSHLPWDDAREEGKASEKWILVNVQDPAVFDCQILNRDVWKDPSVRETIKENFIFMQYNKDDPLGNQYMQFYFKERDLQDAYPHIAIVDPRTGEQVKVWSGPPVPKPMDFLMQLHEFLDRYSLKLNAKNPIPVRKEEKLKRATDVDSWTEDQMLEMALQNSLETQGPSNAGSLHDLDSESQRTKKGKGKAREGSSRTDIDEVEKRDINGGLQQPSSSSSTTSPFGSISSSNPHVEPPADPTTTTRIQFRHSGGRIIRRFLLTDPVRRLYEWLKAEPLDGKAGVEFALVSAGRNLLDQRDESIEQAGLKNQTVMIEFLEG